MIAPFSLNLYRQNLQYADFRFVYRFVVFYGFGERYKYDVVVHNAHHHAALFVEQRVDGSHTHTAGDDAVVGGGRTAALQVSEYGYASVECGIVAFHALGQGCCTAAAFGHNDDATVFRLAEAVFDKFLELLLVGLLFGNDGGLGTLCDGTVEVKKTCIAPHLLDKKEAVVRTGGVGNLVHGIHNGVQRGVVANGAVGAAQIVVDGAG